MKKNFKNGEGRSTILAAAAMLLVFFVAVLFASCDKGDMALTTKGTGTTTVQYDTVIVQGDGITLISTRDDQWGHIHGSNSNTGETHDWVFPLGGITVKVTPHDTMVGNPVVNHQGFVTSTDSTLFDTLEVFHIIKRKITGVDTYDQYSLVAEASWLDGGADCWGYYVPFPSGNGSLNWLSVSGAEDGSDNSWNYTKFTTTYGVGFLGGVITKNAYKTLKREAGSHEFLGREVVSSNWEPLTYNHGFVTSAKSSIRIASHYAGLPDQFEDVAVVGNYPVGIAADSSMYAQNFDFSHTNPVTSQIYTTGTTTQGNITQTDKLVYYSVGTTFFTRVNYFGWPEFVYSDGTYTFNMPSPGYENFSENYAVADLSSQNGYDRKQVTNTVTASIHGITGNAPIKTTIMVAASNPDPDPTIIGYEIVDEGLTYVNPTTNTTWMTIRAKYSNGTYGTPFNVQRNQTNGMASPTLVGIYANCANVMTTGAGVIGAEVLDHQYADGDFTVYVYKTSYTVNCGVFNMVWVGDYEKSVYNPMNHEMPYSTYTYAVSSGSFTPMGQIVENNTTYDQMMWTQYITATLNNHTQQHSGTAEVLCLQTIDRITPDWYGDVIGAYYSRVQKFVGSSFTDNVNFVYTNVIVIMIGGNMNNQVVYARNQATANAHNLPMAPSPNLYISALWNGTAWEPCKINYTGGTENPSTNPTSWTYVNALRDHTVMRGDALGLGIGHVCHPKPTQIFTMSGPVGTLQYPVNNASSSLTGNITYW